MPSDKGSDVISGTQHDMLQELKTHQEAFHLQTQPYPFHLPLPLQGAVNVIAASVFFNKITAEDSYDAFDTDGDDKISRSDLRKAVKILSLGIPEDTIHALYDVLDPLRQGFISLNVWVVVISSGDVKSALVARGITLATETDDAPSQRQGRRVSPGAQVLPSDQTSQEETVVFHPEKVHHNSEVWTENATRMVSEMEHEVAHEASRPRMCSDTEKGENKARGRESLEASARSSAPVLSAQPDSKFGSATKVHSFVPVPATDSCPSAPVSHR